jgi:SAM-dependent methyltransferase
MTIYNNTFYHDLEHGAIASARVIVPSILDYVNPRSIIDVGCGNGAWLSVFREHGIDDLLGIDGDYVDRDILLIPQENFLSGKLTDPPIIERGFDLALSLEVAEHLPSDTSEAFVAYLASLAPVVLFSAAIPFQGGTYHINTQWPEYWARIFERHNYVCVDPLRREFWDNENIAPWYAQNLLLFVSRHRLKDYPLLDKEYGHMTPKPLSLVHPHTYLEMRKIITALQNLDPNYVSLKQALLALPGLAIASLKKKLRRLF